VSSAVCSNATGLHSLEATTGEIINSHLAPSTGAPSPPPWPLMEERKISSLVVAGIYGVAMGVVHLHDLWILELI
jgi:arabinose-5-phosphate isomerase